MDNNQFSKDEWLNSLYQLLITHRDGLTTDQLGSQLPLSKCQIRLPRYSKIPTIDSRFKLIGNNRLVAVSASSLTQEELLGYFNHWTRQSRRRGRFWRILRAMIKDDLLRISHSGRYVPHFRDNLSNRVQDALNPNQGGIFVSEIVFDPSSVYLGQGLTSTLTITNHTEYDVYWNFGRLLQEPNVFCLDAIVFPLCIPAGNSIERTVKYDSDAVGNHSDIFLIRIGNLNFIRHCKASTTTELASRLGPEAPYVRRKRKHRNHGHTASVGDRPNRGPKWPIDLEEYLLPIGEQNLMADKEFENKLGAMREKMLLNNLVHVNDIVSNYKKLFSTLLFTEEVSLVAEIETYGKKMCQFQKEGSFYLLTVPGLAESRPSVLVGDEIIVTRAEDSDNERAPHHKGFVWEVRQLEIKFKMSAAFDALFNASSYYSVDFTFKRTLMNIMHDTLSRILSDRNNENDAIFLRKVSVLFPNHPRRDEIDDLMENLSAIQIDVSNQDLNVQQRRAVNRICHMEEGAAPFVLFGPPGTGKTSTLAEAIVQIVRRNSSAKLLVCAPSNTAADEIVNRLNGQLTTNEMFRLMAFSRQVCDVSEPIRNYCNIVGNQFRVPSMDILASKRVIISTCGTASKLFYLGWKLLQNAAKNFSHVIIDECGQSFEPDVISCFLNVIDKDTRLIIAGDPEQLGPVVQSSIAGRCGLEISLLERFTKHVNIYEHHDNEFGEYYGYNPRFIVKLVNCYRCHPEIIRVPNNLFYLNQLVPFADPALTNEFHGWDRLPNREFPVVFHGCTGIHERELSSPSWFNVVEIETLLSYVRALHSRGISGADIGIIAPYSKQVKKIREALRTSPLKDITVGSCEQFQGQERKVIIISTVRSSLDLMDTDAKFNIGFLSNKKRFNVAVTRAQALLIVVGNPNVLAGDPCWGALYRHCLANRSVVGVDMTYETAEENMRDFLGIPEDEEIDPPNFETPNLEAPNGGINPRRCIIS